MHCDVLMDIIDERMTQIILAQQNFTGDYSRRHKNRMRADTVGSSLTGAAFIAPRKFLS